MRIIVQTESFAPQQELAAFAQGGAAGAVASFVGFCRDVSHGERVERLELDHYPSLTQAVIAGLAHAVALRHDLLDVLVVHRVGAIPAGDAIVLVAALATHRAPALSAVGELMDYLKSEAPVWKREVGPGGARWIEPTAQDYAAAARWRGEQEGSPA